MTAQCSPEPEDEFDEYLQESLSDPGFRAAFEDAEERSHALRCLVKLRKTLKLTQVEVARRMQTTQSSISEFESGATDPLLSTLQRYARAVTARLRVRVEMPTDGPWIPASQGTYSPGATVTLSATRPLEPTGQREISWHNQAKPAHQNVTQSTLLVQS